MDHLRATHDSDWKGGFLFVGNHTILDFLNTRPVQNGEAIEFFPDFNAVLRWFRAAGLMPARETNVPVGSLANTDQSIQFVKDLIDFRERLREAVITWEQRGNLPKAFVTELNRLLNKHPMFTKLKAGGTSTGLWFPAREAEDLYAPLAHSAAMLFTNADPTRVRKCGQCVLHFLDTSKKGTRRWCSMQLCGNRAKVAAYAQRRRQKS